MSDHVVDTINRGEIHFEEVVLDGLVQGVVQRGTLRASTQIVPAEAMRDLIAGLRHNLKMPGQTPDIPDVAIAYCAERVLPDKILEELPHNDRSIRVITPRCARKTLAFYKRFVRSACITCRKLRWTDGWNRRLSKR